jgi:hypothetical protein
VVDTHLLMIVKELPDRVRLTNAGEVTSSGDPYNASLPYQATQFDAF